MPITLYEPRSIAHFEALEQTFRLHQLSGSGEKYFFLLALLVKATVHYTAVAYTAVAGTAVYSAVPSS